MFLKASFGSDDNNAVAENVGFATIESCLLISAYSSAEQYVMYWS